MQYTTTVQDYLQYIEIERGLSPDTLRSYRSNLGKFGAWVGDVVAKEALTTPTLRKYLYAESARGQRPRSIRGTFIAIKGLCVWLIKEGLLEADPTVPLTLPKMDAPIRRVTSDGEVEALFTVVERTADKRKQALHRALLATLVFAGLRANEVCDLRLQDVRPDAGMLIVTSGKGAKRRELYPPADFFDAFNKWLVERANMGCKHDYAFAQAQHKRVAYEGLRQIMIQITTAAGLGGEKVTAHCLRHNFATHLHSAGATVMQVSAALGHSDTNTTFRYLHLNDGDTKAMATLASRRPTTAPPATARTMQATTQDVSHEARSVQGLLHPPRRVRVEVNGAHGRGVNGRRVARIGTR